MNSPTPFPCVCVLWFYLGPCFIVPLSRLWFRARALVVQCTPVDLQRDIILSLPEVIDDRAKDVVIDAFVNMLETDQELTVPLIDGLTNLDLPADTTADVRNTVLDKLGSCQDPTDRRLHLHSR